MKPAFLAFVGKSGDEGLDGIIKEDRLGLDIIYVQAKRWVARRFKSSLARYMGSTRPKEYSFTTSEDATYTVKRIDNDFFESI